jgi:hypothetical protein
MSIEETSSIPAIVETHPRSFEGDLRGGITSELGSSEEEKDGAMLIVYL